MNKLDKLLLNTADPALKRRAKYLIEQISPKDKEKILDLGCGDGYYLYLLSNLNPNLKLTGSDFDKKALESATKNIKNIKLVTGDLMKKLPFKDDYFDKIIMSEVAEHLPDDVRGFKEVYRVLKPGGILCLSVPHQNYPFLWDPINKLLELLFKTHIRSGFWAGLWNQHQRLYSKDLLEKNLKKAGFKIIESHIQTYWCLPFNHYLINLGARILAKNPHSSISKGASKFTKTSKKSLPLKIYLKLSKTIDYWNENFPNRATGVSLVAKVIKI